MLNLRKVRLKYQKYVEPSNAAIVELSRKLKMRCRSTNFQRTIKCLNRWIKSKISVVKLTPTLFSASEVLKRQTGTCFGISCLLCSILRNIGFERSYVIVLRLKNAVSLENMLHSAVIVRAENKFMLFDPVSDEPYVEFKDFKHIIDSIGNPLCAFNDKEAFIPADANFYV